MNIFHFLLEKILFVLAEIYKIQSNWFFEVLAVSISLALIAFFSWSCYKMKKKKRFKREQGFKRYYRRTVYYATITMIVFLSLCTAVHLSLVVYIATSEYKLDDFTLKKEEINQEYLNVNIYDQNGNKVYTIINDGVNRETVTLDEIPKYLEDAFVNTEDKSFYQHTGVSVKGYLRAIYYKIMNPSNSMHGGSTLTQQLIKNINGDMYNRSVLHKYQEALLAIILENNYKKEDILEMYLNRIFLGSGNNGNIHGVGTASKYYFNKDVSELSLSESAFLAGLAQAPSAYTENLELGNQRKNTVLSVMEVNGSITENQRKKASQEKISFTKKKTEQSAMAAYADYVLKEAKDLYGIDEEALKHKGYDIYTYIDSSLQKNIYDSVSSFTFKDDKKSKNILVQVGIAAIDSKSGKIVALYGGRDYVRGYRNRSYDRFQPGSILKPLVVYGPAFETKRWSPFSEVQDKITDFGGYEPHNAGEKYEGPITIERALIRSANVPAVSVLQDIGVEKGINTLEKMGIPIEEEDRKLHIALGGMEKGVTPIEMAQAYTTFQNFGYFEPAHAIKFIKDKEGEIIAKEEDLHTQGIDIFTPENAYHMTEILQKVVENGTGQNAKIGRPLAGKTGTAEEVGTDGNRAAWFVGYTPEVSMAVHLGFDEPSKKQYLTSSGGEDPAKLFSDILKKELTNVPIQEFEKPSDVVSLSEGPLLTKVENLTSKFDKEKQQIVLEWDKVNSFGGITYEIYKKGKGKDKEDILVGTTKDTIFYDNELPEREQLEDIPKDINWEKDWLKGLTSYSKNAFTFVKNITGESRTYYVVASYGKNKTEPSKKEWVFVPKIEKIKEKE